MTLHDQLMRLFAKRGELTLALEQTDLEIVRARGMFDLECAINQANPPAPGSNARPGEETSASPTPASKTRHSRAGAPSDDQEAPSSSPPEFGGPAGVAG